MGYKINHSLRIMPVAADPAFLEGFNEPLLADWRMVDLLHRRNDGFIPITKSNIDASNWNNLCSLPASRLPEVFGQLQMDCGRDAYFGINAMYRGGHGPCRREYKDSDGKLLPSVCRDNEAVRHVTSCFADLDCHSQNMAPEAAIGAVYEAQESGLIPRPSIIQCSGRGIWLYWILTGHDLRDSSDWLRVWKGDAEKIQLWTATQRAITSAFAALGADANARDLARVARIPGSLNSKANKRVSYRVQVDGQGEVCSYTLSQLAAAFGVENVVRERKSKGLRGDNRRIDLGRRGQAERWRVLRENFEKLWELRGKFRAGTRHAAAFLYAAILKSAPGLDESQISVQMEKLYQDFEQPPGQRFTQSELRSAIKGAQPAGLHKIKNQTVADRLEITPDEAAQLIGRKRPFPPAEKYAVGVSHRITRKEESAQRRDLISRVLAALPNVPSACELATHIEKAGFKRPANSTLLRDLRALGVHNPRCHQTRRADKGGTEGQFNTCVASSLPSDSPVGSKEQEDGGTEGTLSL